MKKVLFFYSAGEAATSLVMNGLYGFALLFYTDALGLPASMAGAALSISIFWEAVTEPAMGYLSDRTRSRWGARFPWIIGGGLSMAAAFVAVWTVPVGIRSDHTATFLYLVIANLLLRTGLSAFSIPYLALGFDIVPSYNGRSRLQAVRQVANMVANFCGPALAWSTFLRDGIAADGSVLIGTRQPANYLHMGVTFAAVSAGLVLLLTWGNRNAVVDNRRARGSIVRSPGLLRSLIDEFGPICKDEFARQIVLLTFLACVAMVLLSSMQSYIYVYFMGFDSAQKVFAHGSTMVAMAAGGAVSAWISARADKKGAVAIGASLSICGAFGLAVAFLPGWLPRSGLLSSMSLFVCLQSLYWFGAGITLPVLAAMIGDASELTRLRTGHAHNGGYAAAFSLAMRLAISFSIMTSGWLLTFIGFESNGHPSESVVWRVGAAGFIGGGTAFLLFLERLRVYPLSRKTFDALAVRPASAAVDLAIEGA